MEVLGTPPNDYYDFYYSRISPCFSAPSSPKHFGEIFMSAPTTPSRISDLYSKFEYFSISSPTPKGDDNDGFGFFDGGRIKPLIEDNDLLESDKSPLLCPKHPKRSTIVQGKKLDREVYSPRERNESYNIDNNGESESRRGRDRTPSFASSNSGLRRATRSHSPYIEPHYTWIEESQKEMINKEDVTKGSLSSMLTPKSSRKWRLRDLLLFRSASEGSGSSKDSLGKYPILFRKDEEGKGYSSFRSSNKPPRSKKKETISAHELHYARKKAETEDLKKRTFLPYKKGILGILAGSRR